MYTAYTSPSMVSAEEKNAENNTYDEYHTEFTISSMTFIKLITSTIVQNRVNHFTLH